MANDFEIDTNFCPIVKKFCFPECVFYDKQGEQCLITEFFKSLINLNTETIIILDKIANTLTENINKK